MTDQSDEEFIRECEAHIQEMRDRWQCGPDCWKPDNAVDFGITVSDLSEAVERLRRACAERDEFGARALRAEKAIPVGVIVSEHEQIAELKELIAWAWVKLKSQPPHIFPDLLGNEEAQRIKALLRSTPDDSD